MHLAVVFFLLFVASASAASDEISYLAQRQAAAVPKPAFTLTLLPTSGSTTTTSITPAATPAITTSAVLTPSSTSASQSTTVSAATINVSYVANLLNNLLPMITRMGPMLPRPTTTASLSIPASLQAQIYTAIPPTVLIQLMRASYRSSVAAEFAAGQPPSWFETMSPELQTFVKDLTVAARTTAEAAPVQTAYGSGPGVATPVVTTSAASPSASAPTSIHAPVAVIAFFLCILLPALS